LPESANECTASASMELAPVRRNAMNLVTAIPRFAANAATIARVPPSADMRVSLSTAARQPTARPFGPNPPERHHEHTGHRILLNVTAEHQSQ
jgi:hypothetical protein